MSQYSSPTTPVPPDSALNKRLQRAFEIGITDAHLAKIVLIHPSANPDISENMERLSVLGARAIALVGAETIIGNRPFAQHPKSSRYALEGVVASSSFVALAKSLGIHSLITVGADRNDIVRHGVVTDSDCLRMSIRAIVGAIALESGATAASSVVKSTIATDISTFGVSTRGMERGSINYPQTKLDPRDAQESVGYKFKDPSLLREALLPIGADLQKVLGFWRMDFLGQQLLDYGLVCLVMNCRPEEPASELANSCNKALEQTGLLGEKVAEHPKGPWLGGGSWANLADIRPQFRAVLGAMYLDGAIDRVEQIINDLYAPLVTNQQ